MDHSWIELTESPEALYDVSVAITDLALQGCRIGDDAACIDRSLVRGTRHDVAPDPARLWPDDFRTASENFGRCYTDEHYFFPSEAQMQKHFDIAYAESSYKWLLSDRIDHVIEYGGVLLTKTEPLYGEQGYRIKNGRIVSIRLNARVIPFLCSLSKSDCIRLFGMPDYLDEVTNEDDDDLYRTDIAYERGISLRFDEWEKKFKQVTLYSNLNDLLSLDNDDFRTMSDLKPYVGQPTRLFDRP